MNTLESKLELIEQKLNALLSASAPQSCKYTLHAWLDEWLRLYKAPKVKPITLYALDVAVRVHIKPNLSDVPLNEVDSLEVLRFLNSLQSRTKESVNAVLQGALKAAAAVKIIADNPLQGVTVAPHKRKRGKALDILEQQDFLKKISKHWLKDYFMFLLYTGCRRSEALALRVSDVDFEKKLLHIPGTKTDLSDRTIPLFGNAASVLKAIKPIDGFYFNFRADSISRSFKRVCGAHKLHDLRHTFATNCLNAQIPLKVVQVWLGHSEITTTADIYTHVTQDIDTEAAARLNEFLNKTD